MTSQTFININNAFARATVSLFGGQVLSFIPKRDNRERLFVSSMALLDGSKSIRGGVPICWPWFGAYKSAAPLAGMPSHGFARTRFWHLVGQKEFPHGTELVLELVEPVGPGFAATAKLQVQITVGEELSVRLLTRNTGNTALALGCALHTYFAIDDIQSTRLRGLTGNYSDKTRDWAILPTPTDYGFTAETDRIHLQAAPRVEIIAPNQTIGVESSGHDSIVVWNPWADGSKAFIDLAADDYLRFVCVETALTQGYVLQPGQEHCLNQRID